MLGDEQTELVSVFLFPCILKLMDGSVDAVNRVRPAAACRRLLPAVSKLSRDLRYTTHTRSMDLARAAAKLLHIRIASHRRAAVIHLFLCLLLEGANVVYIRLISPFVSFFFSCFWVYSFDLLHAPPLLSIHPHRIHQQP